MPDAADTPKPGSPEAVARGCTCPIIDNGHGRGHFGDGEKYGWWTTEGCPLHGALLLRGQPRVMADTAEIAKRLTKAQAVRLFDMDAWLKAPSDDGYSAELPPGEWHQMRDDFGVIDDNGDGEWITEFGYEVLALLRGQPEPPEITDARGRP